jgi:transcriptional regulator with XRE-family HTH domain
LFAGRGIARLPRFREGKKSKSLLPRLGQDRRPQVRQSHREPDGGKSEEQAMKTLDQMIGRLPAARRARIAARAGELTTEEVALRHLRKARRLTLERMAQLLGIGQDSVSRIEALADEMKKKRVTKKRMAELMKTSRAQLDRLLDPDNGSATIESLQRAARIVGRELRLELV